MTITLLQGGVNDKTDERSFANHLPSLHTRNMRDVKRSALAVQRHTVGLSQEAVAEAVGVTTVTYARWERGEAEPMAKRRGPLAAALQITTFDLDRLLGGDEPPAPEGHAVPSWLSFYASLEQGSDRLQTFQPITLPGLLQTAAYAEAVIRTNWIPYSDDQVDQMVTARRARQAVLDRSPRPLELSCVVDEAALHRVTGSAHTMGEQLDRLLLMIERPSIQVQILPRTSTATHNAAFGSFSLFTSAGAPGPFMYCDQNLTSFRYDDSAVVIEAHVELFEHLSQHALPPADSVEYIRQITETYR